MNDFLNNSTLITYAPEHFVQKDCENFNELTFSGYSNEKCWLNTYGLSFTEDFAKLVEQNQFDDFLLKLLQDDNHANKVLELENVLFIALKVLKTDCNDLNQEQMLFVVAPNALWSIQENVGTYFEWIRQRQRSGRGLSRQKPIDYLLFLLVESLVDNYTDTFARLVDDNQGLLTMPEVNPTPAFTAGVEAQKRRLLNFKKATISLRNTIVKLENVECITIESKYFVELKEQVNNLISDIDFELSELDSKLSLIFSIQGHRLNEIMKILTVMSAVFIPLTFLTGIYGMNFENIPELKMKNGYFILLAVMATMGVGIIAYFKHKKWF